MELGQARVAQFFWAWPCLGVPQDGNSRGMKSGSEKTIPRGDADASTGLTCKSLARKRTHMAASRLAGNNFWEYEEEQKKKVVKKRSE